MHWLDFAVFGMVALFLSLAYKRGVVLEITDLLVFLTGGFLAFRLYRPIANGLHSSVFSGFTISFLERFCLITIFVVTALVVFGGGLHVQRRVKEEKVLDKEVDSRLGLVVGLVKTTLVVVSVLGLLFYNDAFPTHETRKLKRGAIVSMMLSFSGVVKPFIYVIAPSDLADAYIKKGFGPPPKAK